MCLNITIHFARMGFSSLVCFDFPFACKALQHNLHNAFLSKTAVLATSVLILQTTQNNNNVKKMFVYHKHSSRA